MAEILTNWWVYMYGNQKWAHMQSTIIDTWGDWIVPVLLKTGTQFVDGEERDCGQLYLLSHQNPIIPPTPTLTYTNVKVDGDLDSPDPVTLYQWGYYPPGTIPGGGYEYNGFRFISNGVGNDTKGFYGECYTFETLQDILDAIDNGDIRPQIQDIYFDVYINGTDQPNIWVNWTAPEEFGVATLTPKVWIAVDNNLPLHEQDIRFDTDIGLYVPNTNAWQVDSAGSFTYGGSFTSSYLSIMQNFEQYLNTANRIIAWGIDGIPSYVRLFLQMDYIEYIGELQQVTIQKDGTPANLPISESGTSGNVFNTVVRFHTGEPDYIPPEDEESYPGGRNIDDDGPGRYDPDNPPNPSDFTDPAGFDGNAVLTRTYAVTAATLENIGQKLWTQSYFDVLKIQSNPIENIVAVKQFPFATSTGTTEEIKVGDVAFGINGLKISRMWTHTFGSYTYTGKYKNYMDFAPFTQIKIFLPYIGFVQLDPADLYGSSLSVKYYVDLVTGECMAKLFMDENTTTQKAIPFMSVFGQMGVDIPLTSTDRVQTELKAMSAGLSVFGGATMQLLGGDVAGAAINGAASALSIAGADYTSQRTCSMSPACASYDTQDVFIIIKRPAAEYIDRDAVTGYKHLHGYPCNKYLYLSSFSKGSFVQVDKRSDIKIAMTSAENQMLEQLLTTGVYI